MVLTMICESKKPVATLQVVYRQGKVVENSNCHTHFPCIFYKRWNFLNYVQVTDCTDLGGGGLLNDNSSINHTAGTMPKMRPCKYGFDNCQLNASF